MSDTRGLTSLGAGPLPPGDVLETFVVHPEVDEVVFTTDELVSKCPLTGQRDIYRASIGYHPNGTALESKSLKLYLWTFGETEEGLFAEDLAAVIARRVSQAVGVPVTVSLVQNVRGGITTTVTAIGEP